MHRNLTPGLWNKFLGRMLGGALLMAAASVAAAQDSNNLPSYLGPGVASLGAGRRRPARRRASGSAVFWGRFGRGGYQSAALCAGGPRESDPGGHNLYGGGGEGGVYGGGGGGGGATGGGLQGELPPLCKFGHLSGERSALELGPYSGGGAGGEGGSRGVWGFLFDGDQRGGSFRPLRSQCKLHSGVAAVRRANLFPRIIRVCNVFEIGTHFLYLRRVRLLARSKGSGTCQLGQYSFTGSVQHRISKPRLWAQAIVTRISSSRGFTTAQIRTLTRARLPLRSGDFGPFRWRPASLSLKSTVRPILLSIRFSRRFSASRRLR